ncbi:MAG: hypothetical protein ACI4VP_02500 [Clostridia bacterium]
MKKVISNSLWTVYVMVIGIAIISLYMSKWVPFEEYQSGLRLAIVTLWVYGGIFLGLGIFAIGLWNNIFFKAATNLLLKRM